MIFERWDVIKERLLVNSNAAWDYERDELIDFLKHAKMCESSIFKQVTTAIDDKEIK